MKKSSPQRKLHPPVVPTVTFSSSLTFKPFPGLELELTHAPGAAADSMAAWWAARSALFCGDLFRAAFPMLAPLSGGTPTR